MQPSIKIFHSRLMSFQTFHHMIRETGLMVAAIFIPFCARSYACSMHGNICTNVSVYALNQTR